MGKFLLSKKQSGERTFKVTIVADSNDADYITTIRNYSWEEFEENIADALIELITKHGGSHELESYWNDWIDIPCSDWGSCHSLEYVEVEYIDEKGIAYDVELEGVDY